MSIYYPLLDFFNTLSDRLGLDDPAFKGNPNMNTQTDKNAKVFKVGFIFLTPLKLSPCTSKTN